MTQKKLQRQSERGNVLFFIFLAIVLFAALGFTVSNIMRSGDPNMINEERSELYANEIIDLGRIMRSTVQELKIDGCDNTQISFEGLDDQWGGQYSNPGSPTNNSCHVFDSAGGGALKPSALNDWLYQPWGFEYSGVEFNSEILVESIGSSDSELIFWIYNIKPQICAAINKRLGFPETHSDTTTAFTDEFKGSYSSAADNLGDDPSSIFEGKMSGCQYDAAGFGHFWQVIIAR